MSNTSVFPHTHTQKKNPFSQESPSVLANILNCDFPRGKSKTANLWEKVMKKSFYENIKQGAAFFSRREIGNLFLR
jgi:hypothetical protein